MFWPLFTLRLFKVFAHVLRALFCLRLIFQGYYRNNSSCAVCVTPNHTELTKLARCPHTAVDAETIFLHHEIGFLSILACMHLLSVLCQVQVQEAAHSGQALALRKRVLECSVLQGLSASPLLLPAGLSLSLSLSLPLSLSPSLLSLSLSIAPPFYSLFPHAFSVPQ